MGSAGIRSRGLALLIGFVSLSVPDLGGGTPKASGQIAVEQSFQNEHTRGPNDEFYDVLTKTAFDLSLWGIELGATLEQGQKTHTQRTYLSRRYRMQEYSLSLRLDPFSWRALVEGRDVTYPYAPRKDVRLQAYALQGELAYGDVRLEGAVTQETRAFPHAPSKDERRVALSLAAGAEGSRTAHEPVLVEVSYEHRVRWFLNDPERDEIRRKLGVQWGARSSAGAVEIAFAHEQKDFPRDSFRNRREWEGSLKATLPGSWGELTLWGKLSDVDRPETPVLTRRLRHLQADLKLPAPWGQLEVRLTQRAIRYPHDPDRDRGVWEALLALAGEWKPWVLSASLEHEITNFPQDPERDKRLIRWDAAVTWTRDPWSVSLAGGIRKTHYPDDPARDVRQLKAEFVVDTEPLPGLTLTLKGAWKARRSPNAPTRTTTATAFSLNVKLGF